MSHAAWNNEISTKISSIKNLKAALSTGAFTISYKTPQNDILTLERMITQSSSSKTQFAKEAIHRNPLSAALIQILLHHTLQRPKSYPVVLGKGHYTLCKHVS